MRFGFVGLGQMGAPMACNLARTNTVKAFDTRREALDVAVAAGAAEAASENDFADVDVLILCLPNGEVVENMLLELETGIASTLTSGTTVIDTSTIEYERTLRISQALQVRGIRFLDVPVSGMRKRAEDGTLTMMIGGEAGLVETLRPALSAMASNILHTGAIGSGQLTKLVNQLLFDINAAALAEIMPMACKLGLDPATTASVINSGTGRSYASEYFLPQILTNLGIARHFLKHCILACLPIPLGQDLRIMP